VFPGQCRLEVLRLLVLEWPAVDWTAVEWTVVEWMTAEWAVMEWTAEDLSGRGRRRNWTMTHCRHPTGESLPLGENRSPAARCNSFQEGFHTLLRWIPPRRWSTEFSWLWEAVSSVDVGADTMLTGICLLSTLTPPPQLLSHYQQQLGVGRGQAESRICLLSTRSPSASYCWLVVVQAGGVEEGW
jgi:hypothetical protein